MKRRSSRGVALISVLWVLAVLSVVGLGFSLTVRMSTELAANSAWDAQAIALAHSGIEMTLTQIAEEQSSGKVYCSQYDAWYSYSSDDIGLDFDEGGFTVRVVDEAGKLDINTASETELYQLLGDEELAMAIIDWRDGDDEALEGGSEASLYETRKPAYTPRNDRFKSIGELALVNGMTSELLWGAPEYRYVERTTGETRGLADLLTVASIDSNKTPTGDDKVNLNTSSDDDLLTALEGIIDDAKIQAIIEFRSQFQGDGSGGAGGGITDPTGGNLGGLTGGGGMTTGGGGMNIGGGGGMRRLGEVSTRQVDGSEMGADPDLEGALTDATGALTGAGGGPGSEGSGVSLEPDNTLAFPTTGALIRVPGLDTTDIQAIWDYVTAVDGAVIEGRVNINTAPYEVLAAVMDPTLAEELVSYRESGLPFLTVADLLDVSTDMRSEFESLSDRLTVRSFVFTIESTGRVAGSNVERRIRQIVDVSGTEANVLQVTVY